jgi:cation:H+ antiporter
MLAHVAIYIASFFFIWFGSGLIVSSATKFAKKLKVSPFIFSFLFLGLLTSIPEFSVGLQSIAGNHSEVFVGNLLGGIMVLFTVIIPLLAVIGNGINVKHELKGVPLLLTLALILAPAYFVLDQRVTNLEGGLMIIFYIAHMLFIQRHKGVLDKSNKNLMNIKKYSYKDFLILIAGLGIIFVASNVLLDKTLYFAQIFGVSPFYISLIVIALGTDFPEFILAVRSAIRKKKDVAMGDYMGAAAASTLLFGLFTLLTNGEVLTVNHFGLTFMWIAIALGLFYVFSASKQFITRGEGFVMLLTYAGFIATEILTKG